MLEKYFKFILPTKILSIFIDIGNYKHNLSLYSNLIKEINSLTENDLKDILKKANELANPKEGDIQTIGGYTIIELIVRIVTISQLTISNNNVVTNYSSRPTYSLLQYYYPYGISPL